MILFRYLMSLIFILQMYLMMVVLATFLVASISNALASPLAATLGLPIWPLPRPKPVMWLAIDDGSGPRLAGLPQANAVRPALDRAKDRGFALGLPAATAAEQAVVGAIWRGDTAAVARASARYSPPMQLVGKLYRDKGGWTADWVFVDAGKVLAKWSVSDPDARRAMSAGAHGMNYQLYSDAARTTVWGTTGGDLVNATGTGVQVDHTVYGRVAASQNVAVGSYTDTVNVTVTYN